MGKITVVGSFVVDLMSKTPHMPVPGETVLGGPFKMGPGGKGGNQAVAAARLGADVVMVTKLGNDSFGEMALENFKNEKIKTDYISIDDENTTGAALIAVDETGENMIVVALGACGNISPSEIQKASNEISNSDIVLLQLETNLEAVIETIKLAEKYSVPVILNPAPYQEFPKELLKKVTYITPNETEASQLTGIEVNSIETAKEAAKYLFNKGVKNVIITLGKKGCLLYNDQFKGELIDAFKVNAIDTTGAGDAFNGGVAYALSNKEDLMTAIIYGNATAGLSVQKVGTAPAMPYLEEVKELIVTRYNL